MEYRILGLPYNREGFRIDKSYRGICRNELPEAGVYKRVNNEKVDELISNVVLSKVKKYSESYLLNVAEVFSDFSDEPFELILIKGVDEKLPNCNVYRTLGFDIIVLKETSMIHFWLRRKVEDYKDLFEKYIGLLNENYLFRSVFDALEFRNEIYLFSKIIDPTESMSKDDFEIVEIILVARKEN